MARILINYAPDAGPAARELALTLWGRGHEVVFGSEDKEALYKAAFDAAVVVWSREGLQSEKLLAFAKEARKLDLLISMRRADHSLEWIPAEYREPLTPFARDVDALLASLQLLGRGAQPGAAQVLDKTSVKRIFLSYAKSDRAVAANIADELRRRGHDVFMPDFTGSGDDFERKIRKAIGLADLTVAVVSPAFLESPYVLAELELARATQGAGGILPVAIVPTNLAALPESLRGVAVLQPGDNLAEEIAEAVSRRQMPPVVFLGAASPEEDNAAYALGPKRSAAAAPLSKPVFDADEPKPTLPRDEPATRDARRVGVGAGVDPADAERRKRTYHIGGASAAAETPEPSPALESAGGSTLERYPASRRVEGVGAAAPVARQPAPAPAPAAQALEVEAGKLVHKIPDKMWLGEPETVEVRIGREAAAGLTSGLVGRGGLTEENIPIVETMSVSLYARGGAFEIERQSETTQLVKADAVANTLFASTDFGRWTWAVTPKKTGAQNLFVKVSAGLKDSRGVPTTAALPDRTFTVSVAVNKGRAAVKFLRGALLAGGGAAAAGLLGAITQELWWPWLKALFMGG